MNRSLRINGSGWLAIAALNVLHYAVLALLVGIGLLLLLGFLTHDADHVRIRARIDHVWSVWTASHGEAEKRLGLQNCIQNSSEMTP